MKEECQPSTWETPQPCRVDASFPMLYAHVHIKFSGAFWSVRDLYFHMACLIRSPAHLGSTLSLLVWLLWLVGNSLHD